MQISHVISDGVLTLTGLFVFFRYLLKLNLTHTVLWESFVLSVTAAAFFGTLRFWGLPTTVNASVFFQHLAVTAGAVGLIAASWALITGVILDKIFCYVLLATGFLFFAVAEGFSFSPILEFVPIVAMLMVGLAGIYGLVKKKTIPGLWLLAGVIFMGISSFIHIPVKNTALATDLYHYLVAAGLLCFGFATNFHSKPAH